VSHPRYTPEPSNSQDGARQIAREEIRAFLQGSSTTSSYAPKSVPWLAVDLPVVSSFPVAPQDRDEVNLLDEDTGYVSRWIYLNSQSAWREIRSQGDFPGQVSYSAGADAPAGWLVADGSAVSRTTYASLFSAIGTTHGVGDGSTTFNLPDLEDVFVAGVGASALGVTGGAATHTLTTAEMPAHTHTWSYHVAAGTVAGAANAVYDPNVSAPNASYATSSTGGGGAHNNLPPYIALTPIIRT
jgi:microcystin-dependent protein